MCADNFRPCALLMYDNPRTGNPKAYRADKPNKIRAAMFIRCTYCETSISQPMVPFTESRAIAAAGGTWQIYMAYDYRHNYTLMWILEYTDYCLSRADVAVIANDCELQWV